MEDYGLSSYFGYLACLEWRKMEKIKAVFNGSFDALENIELCLQSMTAMIASLKANKKNMELAAASQFSTATDLADWLVQNLNIPFRTAHEITGKIDTLINV